MFYYLNICVIIYTVTKVNYGLKASPSRRIMLSSWL